MPNDIYNPNNQEIIIENEIKNIDDNENYVLQNNNKVIKKEKITDKLE